MFLPLFFALARVRLIIANVQLFVFIIWWCIIAHHHHLLLLLLLLLLLRLLSEKLPSSRSWSSAWNQRAATRTGKKRRDFQRSVHRARRRPQLFVFRLLFAPVRVSYCFHRFCFRHPIFTDDGFRFYRFLHRFSVCAEHVLAFSRRRARPGFLLPPVSLHGLVREQGPSLLS